MVALNHCDLLTVENGCEMKKRNQNAKTDTEATKKEKTKKGQRKKIEKWKF